MPGFSSGLNAGRKLRGAFKSDAVYKALGTPSVRGAFKGHTMTPEQVMRRGRRRAIIGGGGMGTALTMNAFTGPNGNRSTGGKGYVNPKSSGGYA